MRKGIVYGIIIILSGFVAFYVSQLDSQDSQVSSLIENKEAGNSMGRLSKERPKTSISFVEKSWNFGQVMEGPKYEHSFTFTNTGNENLIIENAKGSCGCTVPSWPKEPIPPGGKGQILVTFNSKGRIGANMKRVTIVANTDSIYSVITIEAEVMSQDVE
jgi:hypothetical protein